MQKIVRKFEIVAIVTILIWLCYNLIVLLKTGFISDDAYSSQIKGAILQEGITLNQRILNEVLGWIKGSGRILILDWYMTYGLYYVTQDPVVVKSINIAIILSGVLFFYYFSKRETGSQQTALLACALMPIFFQFRLWHDPILAFTFLIPIIFALTMGSLVLFQKYLDEGDRFFYVGAVVVYLTALLMYEIGYPLCLLFFIVAYARQRKLIKSIKWSLPFTGFVALILLLSASLRMILIKNSVTGSTYPGAELHLNIGKLISAFSIQVSSSFPLNYYLFAKPGLPTKLYALDYVFLSVFFAGIAALIYKLGKSTKSIHFASWLASGIVLLFIPAALSSLSGHQVELNTAGYGFGYITVYIQYFGACIFVVSLIAFIARKARGRWLITVSILLSIGLTVVAAKNLKLNRAVALNTNEVYLYPRQLLQLALEAGIADEVKEGAFLFRTMRYPSDWMWFYTTVTGKNFITCELADAKAYADCIAKLESYPASLNSGSGNANTGFEVIDLSKKDAWVLSYNFEKSAGDSGRVILGKVDKVVQNKLSKTPIQIVVSKISAYDLKTNQIQKIDLQDKPINFLKITAEQTADMSQVKPLDYEALRVDPVDFEWLGKVHEREGTNADNLRWSSGEATLILHNLSNTPKRVQVTMGLGTPTKPSSKLMIQFNGKTEVLTLGQTPVNYSKTLLLEPGTTAVTFTSDAKPIENGDPRKIVFGIFNFKVVEVAR